MAEKTQLSRELFYQLGKPDSQDALIELLTWLSKDDASRLTVIAFFSAIGEQARQEQNEEILALFSSLIERMTQIEEFDKTILALALGMALKNVKIDEVDA